MIEEAMPQKVVGLVMLLMREIREHRLKLDEIDLFSEDLLGQGYTETEINAAFSWVFSRLDGIEPAEVLFQADANRRSFRVLHPIETAVLRPEAYGQLLEMYALKMLNLEDVERIIERAMSFGGPLGAEEIRLMVHTILFEEGNSGNTSNAIYFSIPSNTIH